MHLFVSRVIWNVELIDAGVNVSVIALRHCYVVQGVLIADYLKLWVFLDAKHLVKELERLVLGLCFLQALVTHLDFIIFVARAAFDARSSYESPLANHLCNLFLRHDLGTFFEAFRTQFLHQQHVLLVRVVDGNTSIKNYINGVCTLTEARKASTRTQLLQLDLLHHRLEICRFKLRVGLEERHAA